jgi:hypothetical protein
MNVYKDLFIISDSGHFKEFIKLIINFIKQSHLSLVGDLNNFNTESNEYHDVFDEIIKTNWLLFLILFTVYTYSNSSIEFCIRFQEDDENGIKVILDFMNEKEILSAILNNKNNFLMKYFKCFNFSLFASLFYLSKTAYKNKDKWNDLNAFNNLLTLSDKTTHLNFNYQLFIFLTIANIATEEDLKTLSISSTILDFLTQMVKEFAKQLDNDDQEEVKKTKIKINESNDEVEVIVIKGWNLVECIEALHKLAINDTIKSIIYKENELKDSLKKIIYKGNEVEKEYAFKLLNQLCFDNKIAFDVKSNAELVDFMKEENEYTRLNLIKNIDSIIWMLNQDVNITKIEKVIPNKTFISYNSESRELCLKIKERLESVGYEIWIDVENLHGYSIYAMANGIESASCVLICMTEKY